MVRWPVYRAWLELAGAGFDGRNEDWDGVLHENIANAEDEKEAFLMTQVWVFGLHYGLDKRDGVEIDGELCGHGGLMDRFDGLLGAALFMLLVAQLTDVPSVRF